MQVLGAILLRTIFIVETPKTTRRSSVSDWCRVVCQLFPHRWRWCRSSWQQGWVKHGKERRGGALCFLFRQWNPEVIENSGQIDQIRSMWRWGRGNEEIFQEKLWNVIVWLLVSIRQSASDKVTKSLGLLSQPKVRLTANMHLTEESAEVRLDGENFEVSVMSTFKSKFDEDDDIWVEREDKLLRQELRRKAAHQHPGAKGSSWHELLGLLKLGDRRSWHQEPRYPLELWAWWLTWEHWEVLWYCLLD